MSRKPWTEVEIELLRRNYADSLTTDIAAALGRSVLLVYSKANKLGLRKSAQFNASSQSGRLLKGGTLGQANQFKPGLVPWNKGKHYPASGRAVTTQFKPGQKPHTWVPIGSYRIADGILQRKCTDTGYSPSDFVSVHRLVWEAANGPVPAGHVAAFKPGRKTTELERITLDAVELLSRAQVMARNSVHRLPKQLVSLVQLRGVLNRRINRLAKAKPNTTTTPGSKPE